LNNSNFNKYLNILKISPLAKQCFSSLLKRGISQIRLVFEFVSFLPFSKGGWEGFELIKDDHLISKIGI